MHLHAISRAGNPTHLDPAALKADMFLPYIRRRSGKLSWLGWYALIKESKLVTRDQLIREFLLTEAGLQSHTEYYYLIRFDRPISIKRTLLPNVRTLVKRPGYPTTRKWAELLPAAHPIHPML